MPYSYKSIKGGYSRAIVGGIKYLIGGQPKSNLTIALKQTQKAAPQAAAKKLTKSTLITIKTLGLVQSSQATSKFSNLFFISLTTASTYSRAILVYNTSAFTLLYFQYSSKITTILLILAFSRYSYNNSNNNSNNNKEYSSSKSILYLPLSYNLLTQSFSLLLKGNYITQTISYYNLKLLVYYKYYKYFYNKSIIVIQ